MVNEKPSTTMISVVIPTLNEESYIGACLNSATNAECPDGVSVEIIVVDGGSVDRTTSIVSGYEKRFDFIKLIKLSSANCPESMNSGIAVAQGQYIAKVDAHGFVNKAFFKVAMDILQKCPMAGCVGGPITPLYTTPIGQANLLARHSFLGVGGGSNTLPQHDGSVDSVQCGIYRLNVLKEVGFFDAALEFGEDEELNFRIRKKGYQIINTPQMTFYYYTRSTFKGLFRQYFNYGNARVRVIRKHPSFFSLKHIVPSTFAALVFLFPVAFIAKPLRLLILTPLSLYGLILFLASSWTALKEKRPKLLAFMPVSFFSLHLAYGIGFMAQLSKPFTSHINAHGPLIFWRVSKICRKMLKIQWF